LEGVRDYMTRCRDWLSGEVKAAREEEKREVAERKKGRGITSPAGGEEAPGAQEEEGCCHCQL
jgi:hypothetical protein